MTRAAATCLFAAIWAAACSYDWTVAPAADGGIDAGIDANVADASPGADAALGADASDASNVDCNGLAQRAEQQKTAAKACGAPLNQACQLVFKDECGCDQVVGNFDTNAVDTYAGTLAQFHDAGCAPPPACPAQCPSANKGLCIVDNPDAGTLKCSQ